MAQKNKSITAAHPIDGHETKLHYPPNESRVWTKQYVWVVSSKRQIGNEFILFNYFIKILNKYTPFILTKKQIEPLIVKII